jgi:DNA modification methylase
MLGYKNRRTVVTANLIAKAAETMPELSAATTTSEAVKMIQTKVRLEAQQELAKRFGTKQKGPIENPTEFFSSRVILGDCLEGMKSLSPGMATIFLTDIPYGIDYKPEGDCLDKAENKDITKKVLGFYEDKPAEIISLVEKVIQQISRVGRPNCFVYMFCAFRHWNHLVGVFQENGFNVYNKPITWIRGSFASGKLYGGVCRLPAKWPASSSDCIIFASRGNAALAKQGQPDVIFCSPISTSEKIHVVQRPVPLLTELISRVFHPETKGLLIDPFAGSGSSLAAAMQFDGLSYFGYELDPENRKRAVAYWVNEYNRMINPEPEADIEDLEI